MQTSNPEVHNLVANSGYPQQQRQSYAHDYPKTDYYDQQAVAQQGAHAYGGQGYAAPQAYEPYSHQQTATVQGGGQQQQGYELNQRSAV